MTVASIVAALAFLPAVLPAQSVTVTGRVLHGGEDNRPVAGNWAVLHEIRQDGAGPLDSARTDGSGRYRLRISQPDTSAFYVVSTNYHGVGYFSSPVRVEGRGSRAETDPVVVHDTTTGGPAMRLARRLLVLFRTGSPMGEGDAGGAVGADARNVIELVEIENPGTQTRIASDSLHPVWTMTLPHDAMGFQIGEGDLSPEAMLREGDTVKVYAPIWPGGPRQASFQYFVRGSTVQFPIDQPLAELDLLLEDTSAVLTGVPLDTMGINTYEAEGRRFAAYRAGPLQGGAVLTVKFSGSALHPEQLVPYIAGVAGLALAWGLWVALRKKPSAVSAGPSKKPSPSGLQRSAKKP